MSVPGMKKRRNIPVSFLSKGSNMFCIMKKKIFFKRPGFFVIMSTHDSVILKGKFSSKLPWLYCSCKLSGHRSQQITSSDITLLIFKFVTLQYNYKL